MRTPYNNGKVKIGQYYEPPKYVEEDSDMLTIQGWLIGDKKAARRKFYERVAYCVFAVVTLVLSFLNT
jgi:hypothetical protein